MTIPDLDELQLLHNQICQAVADPRRIQILYALHEQPANVSTLAGRLDMPQSSVSRHLALLRGRSMVIAERNGQTVVYRLADGLVIEVLELMRRLLHETVNRRASTLR